MPRAKKVEAVQEAVEEVKPVVVPTVTTESGAEVEKTEFEVYNSSGGYVRTYSLELHGEDAEKLAHQFAGKIGGSVR
jgi:hypothetical protein